MSRNTIFALSSGRPPSAIAIIRISGTDAQAGLRRIMDDPAAMPAPRRASVRRLHHPVSHETLDTGMVLWMPGPDSATGEDIVELHVHGGRAVIDAVIAALNVLPGHRYAEPGEFTRRAFENGRIDLNEAEGLSDLLAAETDAQRRAALLAAGGAVSRQVEQWRTCLLGIAASAEAAIDYSDEVEDDAERAAGLTSRVRRLRADIEDLLQVAPAERMRGGIRVVIAGPPNVGKSTLLNAIAGRQAAIVSANAGTTRDVIEVPINLDGIPIVLIDTAGLRNATDLIEREGVSRAVREAAAGDVLVWLGENPPPDHPLVIAISPQADHWPVDEDRLGVSATTGLNLRVLKQAIAKRAADLLPPEGAIAFNARQRALAVDLRNALSAADAAPDTIVQAEELRIALHMCDRFTGTAGVEDMLDSLFSSFCLGK